MKKSALFSIITCITMIYGAAHADGYTETENIKVRGQITIDTVKYYDGVYVHQRQPQPAPCRVSSSLDVARKCDCKKANAPKPAPIRVKTYTEVIDHYQVYQPVITYKPAGTYTTRRYIDAKNPHCNTCAR